MHFWTVEFSSTVLGAVASLLLLLVAHFLVWCRVSYSSSTAVPTCFILEWIRSGLLPGAKAHTLRALSSKYDAVHNPRVTPSLRPTNGTTPRTTQLLSSPVLQQS